MSCAASGLFLAVLAMCGLTSHAPSAFSSSATSYAPSPVPVEAPALGLARRASEENKELVVSLRDENGDLRSILKQYLDGISVNEDVINAPNPLLVVNHKTNIVMPNAQRVAPVSTVIEGSHVQMIGGGLQGQQGASI